MPKVNIYFKDLFQEKDEDILIELLQESLSEVLSFHEKVLHKNDFSFRLHQIQRTLHHDIEIELCVHAYKQRLEKDQQEDLLAQAVVKSLKKFQDTHKNISYDVHINLGYISYAQS
ncbi:MAG: hypothetical protein MRY57_03720 [Candidatus Pacebacteria bacterium]|nr:hypothetical protein [Candidatus Paceibacterota bacterium]